MHLVWYAASPVRRTVQLVGDVALVAWVVVWVWLARTVHDATAELAAPGRSIQESGAGMAEQLRGAGDAVADAPLIGDQLRAPLDGAGGAADQLSSAGTAQVEAVETLAFWLGLTVALVPVLLALAFYLPARIRFVRRASVGQRFLDSADDLDLFALRAMAHQPLHRLAAVSPDPARAWRAGDAEVVRRLAALELRDVGLRAPG